MAVHLSGAYNAEADRLSFFHLEISCEIEYAIEWSSKVGIARQLFDMWGLPTVDLFTTR